MPNSNGLCTTRGGNPYAVGYLGYALGRVGQQAEAERQLEELHELSKSKFVPTHCMALVWLGLGNNEQALEWLERAHEEREHRMVLLKHDGIYDPLRDDSRFQDLVRRVGV